MRFSVSDVDSTSESDVEGMDSDIDSVISCDISDKSAMHVDWIYVDENPHKSGASFREEKLNNRRAVFGADLIGIDRTDMEYLCVCLDIPGPTDSRDTVHQKDIRSGLKKVVMEKLQANRESISQHCAITESGIALATVKVDGTYQKRGAIYVVDTRQRSGWFC